MDSRKRLVIALAFAFCSAGVQAGYAQLQPPAGWSGGSSASTFNYGAAANSATISNGTVRTNASLSIGGRPVTVPAAMRFSANAGRVAATAAFANPAWFVVAGLVVPGMVELYDYYKNNNMEVHQDVWKQRLDSSMCVPDVPGCSPPAQTGVSYNYVTLGGGSCAYQGFKNGVSIGYWCVGSPQEGGQFETITLPKFVEIFSPKPIPNILPEKMPIPLPVELPIINPSPGDNPSPQPLFVPTGNPVANPNYNPSAPPSPANQPFLQPGVRVVPAPTPSEPWRVDLQPVDRPVASPDPLPGPESETNPDAGEQDKPKEDEKSLCELHPDILACAKTGDLTEKSVGNTTKNVAIIPDGGYGPSNGTCPAPKTASVMGVQLAMHYDLICQFAENIRPIVIAFAWLSAALTFMGFSRKDS